MYQVYIDKPSYFEAEMAAEFKDWKVQKHLHSKKKQLTAKLVTK